MGAILRVVTAYIVALAVTTALATAASTHFVILGLTSEAGAQIGMSERLSMTLHDLMQMGPFYAQLIGAGLVIAFCAAAILARIVGVRGGFWIVVDYTVAGAVALFAILMLLEIVFDMQIIAGARTVSGFWAQVICGAVGGFLFGLLVRPRVT